MTELTLQIMEETPNSTCSSLRNGDHFITFIIEDGYHAIKIPGETRIPGGRYKLIKKTDGKFFAKYSKEYGHKFVIEISNVPNYIAILFHIGNRATDPLKIDQGDTRGCMLTNDSVTFDRKVNEFIGVNSTIAYRKFYNYMEPLMDAGDVYLNVIR